MGISIFRFVQDGQEIELYFAYARDGAETLHSSKLLYIGYELDYHHFPLFRHSELAKDPEYQESNGFLVSLRMTGIGPYAREYTITGRYEGVVSKIPPDKGYRGFGLNSVIFGQVQKSPDRGDTGGVKMPPLDKGGYHNVTGGLCLEKSP